jgi:hypothetical protein
VDGVG